MANQNKNVIISYFDSVEKATAAAEGLKTWDKANDDIKLGGIGVLTVENGEVKTHNIGATAAGAGAKAGTVIGIVAGVLSGGIGLVGGAETHRLQEQDAREVAVLCEREQSRAKCGLDLAERTVRARDPGGDRLGEPRRQLVDQREEQRLLVREVVVDGALRRAGRVDDVVHESPVIPFPREDLPRRVEDLVARRRTGHRRVTPREVAC